MNIGFTYDSKAEYIKKYGEKYPLETFAEFDKEETLVEILSALSKPGYVVERIGNVENLIKSILDGKRWDLVFNIAEGWSGRNRESQVPMLLELFKIPYTGSDALTMGVTLDKSVAKKIVAAEGILTPKFIEIFDLTEVKKLNLRFPLLVKPSQEGTSKGLTKNSLVRTYKELREQVEYVIKTFSQPVLVEEFIIGKEFTVVVMGNTHSKKFPVKALPVVQIAIHGKTDLGEEFYTHSRVESKEINYICPSEEDESLLKKVATIAEKTYKVLEVRDFGRIDIRVDYDDVPYFLECNPLPNLGKTDVFPLVAEATGVEYKDLIWRIVEIAIDRYSNISALNDKVFKQNMEG